MSQNLGLGLWIKLPPPWPLGKEELCALICEAGIGE